jgi:hypothetical protein
MWEEETRSVEEEADGAANGGANSAGDDGGQCNSGDGCSQEVLRVLPGLALYLRQAVPQGQL